MKNYILLFTILSFLVACSSANESEDNKTDKIDTTASTGEEEWNAFKEDFILAVTKNDMGGVVNSISFPLRNLIIGGQIKESTSKVDFIKNYKNIFGNGLRERIIYSKIEEWKSIVIKNNVEAQMYNAPMNAEIKTLHLNYIMNEGKSNQTESAIILSFVKMDGKYKWSSMNVAG